MKPASQSDEACQPVNQSLINLEKRKSAFGKKSAVAAASAAVVALADVAASAAVAVAAVAVSWLVAFFLFAS